MAKIKVLDCEWNQRRGSSYAGGRPVGDGNRFFARWCEA